MTQASEVVKTFSGLFSSSGITLIWTAFAVGVFARWLANSRVKSQLGFLNSVDRSLQGVLKGSQALSQGQLREKLEGFFRTYFSAKGGRPLFVVDKMLGVEASSWQIVDRLVSLAYDRKGASATERSRHLLMSLPSLTRFFSFFSLGSLHRIGAATPAILVLLGALGTYAGFLHALPILAGADISDMAATNKAVQTALFRLFSDTGYTILGTILAITSVLINASLDAERSFHGAVNRLAHVVELLGNLEKSGNSTEKVRQRVEDERPVEAPTPRRQREVVAEEAAPEAAPETAPELPEANPFEEISVERTPRDRIRQRAQVVQAEQDWGPLPLSAVPSPRKKPIRVEPADVPKPEEGGLSDDQEVVAHLRPELHSQADLAPPFERNAAALANEQAAELAKQQAAELAKQQAAELAKQQAADLAQQQVAARSSSPSPEFVIPETALPADWEDQIRGLKTQLASMEEPDALKQAVQPAPPFEMEQPTATEVAIPVATNIETPFDDLLERTVSGAANADGGLRANPEVTNAMPDSPTEAELLAMMVPKEWATQRPADLLPQSFEENVTSIKIAETRPAATATALSAAEQDRLAILNHRMDKVQLYLRKANEDLTEGIISQEMFDDESSRWKVEIESLTKDIASLTAKQAA